VFQGLRTVVYPVADLDAAKAWWSEVLGIEPYFDEPYYVGFSVNGYELALDPHGHAESGAGPVTYWGVADVEVVAAELLAMGGREHTGITDYGGEIRTTVVAAPDGTLVGLIENPHFPATLEAG
jgi:predicted enzyme related to lactoylglutathione lyase